MSIRANFAKISFFNKKREWNRKQGIINAFLNKTSTKQEKALIYIYNKAIMKDLMDLGGMYLKNLSK